MKQTTKRILSLLLVLAFVAGFVVPVNATEQTATDSNVTFTQVDNSAVSATLSPEVAEKQEQTPDHADTDMVRVSIVLAERSTVAMGYSVEGIATSSQAMAYRQSLREKQTAITAAIEKTTGEKLDVVWNLTLAANIISANVPYGKMDAIAAVDGVAQVVLETRYDPAEVTTEEPELQPNMAVSTQMNGTQYLWDLGYTGAGTRIAIIDTGLNTDHQSFSPEAFEYAIAENAAKEGLTMEAYMEKYNFLDAEEIAGVMGQLNAARRYPQAEAQDFYCSSKVPFGYNYVDNELRINHMDDMMLDTSGGHGSHVAGIAAANRYIPESGGFVDAMEAVAMVGNAPDAQVLVMKVFGIAGGAYDSDLHAAIEDAILLGCDVVNLSLGSNVAGFTSAGIYQDIWDNLQNTDTILAIAAGNQGSWVENTAPGSLYAEDIGMDTVGSPGSYTNALAVASVENDGHTGHYLQIGNKKMAYMDTRGASNVKRYNLDPTGTGTEYEFVFIDGLGKAEDYAGMDVSGKLVFCSRGETSFVEKVRVAIELGAAGIVVYNNVPGIFGMELSELKAKEKRTPAVSITQEAGAAVKASGTAQVTDDGLTYYTGTIWAYAQNYGDYAESEYLTMSSFSSWGIPGDLSMKPEITAPGGQVYSLDAESSDDAYVSSSGTSMATPQVAGMAALVMQYIRENNLHQEGMTDRALAQSLLMSTAEPLLEEASGCYYPILRQGAGLAAVDQAVSAVSYITVQGQEDGKVKAELGDDPNRTGVYTFTFTLHDLSGQDMDYILSADLFTQAVFEGYVDETQTEVGLYMDTLTDPMDTLATFRVGDKLLRPLEDLDRFDYNGDNLTDLLDAQLLMDHILGQATLEADTDVNGDGQTTSYDVHELLNRLGSGVLTVPANGTITVEVTLTLTEEQKAKLDANFVNGAYVEGFVSVTPLASAEGLLAPEHTIPVLGFYGNWSDPSMFDKGSHQTFLTGEAKPYYVAGYANSLVYRYRGSSFQYYLAGNPVVTDETYLPERNAWNNSEGRSLDALYMTLVRNVDNSRILVTNLDTGELLHQQETGGAYAPYFSSFYGWQLRSTRFAMEYTGEGLPEGTRMEVTLEAATEYHRKEDGTTDWNALGDGSRFSTQFTIDNTTPDLLGVSHNLLDNTLQIQVQDNQYVAGARLYAPGGYVILRETGSNQSEAGETALLTMDLTDLTCDGCLLQILDYAGNYKVYELNLKIGVPVELAVMAYETTRGQLVRFGLYYGADPMERYRPYDTITSVATPDFVVNAAADVNGLMFATSQKGSMYVINEADPSDYRYVGETGRCFMDLAFNRVDGLLYGITQDSEIYAIDMMSAETTYMATVPFPAVTLAIDRNGNFYAVIHGVRSATINGTSYTAGSLFRFTLDTIESPSLVYEVAGGHETKADGVQALEWDPNTGYICEANFLHIGYNNSQRQVYYNDIFIYDVENGTYTTNFLTKVTDMTSAYLSYHLTGLIFPEKGIVSTWPEDTDEVSGVGLPDTLQLVPGESSQLRAAVIPWNATDRRVTWETSDDAVVSVDKDGNVTAKSVGSAVITATSVLDPTKSTTCLVTVSHPQVQLSGIVEKEVGDTRLFTWDLSQGGLWQEGAEIDLTVGSAVFDTAQQRLYISDGSRNQYREFGTHEVDLTTGALVNHSTANMGYSMWDMAYMPFRSTGRLYGPQVIAINGANLLFPMSPLAPTYRPSTTVDVSSFLYDSGASSFLAITSGGTSKVNGLDYGDRYAPTADLIYALDDTGNIWTLYIYQDNNMLDPMFITNVLMSKEFKRTDPVATDLPLDLSVETAVTGDRTNVSMWCDQTTGTLYLSYYTGTDTQIWRLTYNEMTLSYESTLLTTMEGVGPVRLYDGENLDTDAAQNAVTPTCAITESVSFQPAVSVETAPAGRVNAVEVRQSQPVKPATAGNTHILELPQPEPGTNGVVEIAWNPDEVTLRSVEGLAEVTRWTESDGTLKLGYAWGNEMPENTVYAALTFESNGACETQISVITEEYNAVTEPSIAFLELAFGHDFEAVVTAPTCTEAGYTTYTCSVCGDSYVDDHVDALGHDWSEWTVTVPATCTEDGEEARTCPVCGETETRTIDAFCATAGYTDVPLNAWYYDAVDYVVANGIMEGVAEGIFDPNGTTTRAQLVTVLYRLEGMTEVELTEQFTDVAEGAWYAEAVAWAYANGITTGVTETAFAPNASVTREQVVVFLARYAEFKGIDTASAYDLSDFADASSVKAYATSAFAWAVENGIINGMDGRLAPTATSTRAQIATILMRFMEM